MTDTPVEQGRENTPPDGGADRGARGAGGRTPKRRGDPQRAARRRRRRCSPRTATTRRACPTSSGPPASATARSTSTSRSRRDILLELTRQAADNESRLPRLKSRDLADRIRAEIFWYLSDHVEHLELSKVWHDGVELRSRDRRDPAARAGPPDPAGAQGHRGGGRARPDIDPDIAAAALTAMLEEFAAALVRRGRRPGRQRPGRRRRLRDTGRPLARSDRPGARGSMSRILHEVVDRSPP